MKIFKLPDLGEGLPDAIIREWYVKVGDEVKVDQPLAAMETAKALVDVPAPFSGKVEKSFGDPGDTIETGHPLVAFAGTAEDDAEETKDAGTVVGAIEESETVLEEAAAGITSQKKSGASRVKATPAIRMLAKQLGVDLNSIASSGRPISAEDVKQAAQMQTTTSAIPMTELDGKFTPLSNVRRAMVLSMTQSHREIVPVTLMDDADLYAWSDDQDITVRLIRAIQIGCEAVPMLNAYFDSQAMAYQLNENINVGMAVDTPEGLFVPVLKNVANCSDAELRTQINRFKEQAQTRSIPQQDLHGATTMLSNFGAFAGRYANPIIVPPMVSIIGVGRTRDAIVPDNGKPAVHRIIPLSITIDHRAVTGGEAARFLRVMIDSLQEA